MDRLLREYLTPKIAVGVSNGSLAPSLLRQGRWLDQYNAIPEWGQCETVWRVYCPGLSMLSTTMRPSGQR